MLCTLVVQKCALTMLNVFLKRTADVLAGGLSVMFCRLLCQCSFRACCRQANVTKF